MRIRRAKGCPLCNYTGYRGRTAIHEILLIDKNIRKLITTGVTSEEIEEYAVEHQSMRTLKLCGMQMVLEGVSTIEELQKVAYYA